MAVDDIPGVTVAVMQNGQFRYARGFGHADIAAGVWMDAAHVLRTASVSKAVGGVLTLRLHEQGVLDRDDLAADYLDLPAFHTATLEELASNRGCVRHYADDEAVADPEEYEAQLAADNHLTSTKFSSATGATLHFRDDPLLLNCTIGDTEEYSTHGTVLGSAAEEQAIDTPIDELVRQQISDLLGLTTLRQEDTDDTTVRRPKIYAGEANDEIDFDETSWKTVGGGLESDVRDLARFGDALLAGQIISAANVEYMFSGTGWDYAYGWNILADDDGHRRVGKSGGGPGVDSYLLMYPGSRPKTPRPVGLRRAAVRRVAETMAKSRGFGNLLYVRSMSRGFRSPVVRQKGDGLGRADLRRFDVPRASTRRTERRLTHDPSKNFAAWRRHRPVERTRLPRSRRERGPTL